MKNIIKLDLFSLFDMFSKVSVLMDSFSKNNKIFLEYDIKTISKMTKDDINKYRGFLYILAEKIYNLAIKKGVFVEINVITDSFFIKQDFCKIPSNLDICKVCPCLHCIPPVDFFESNKKNQLPLVKYCELKFIEKEVSLFLMNKFSELNLFELNKDILEMSISQFIVALNQIYSKDSINATD